MRKQTNRFIGKGKYDKKFHLIQDDDGLLRRICVWRTIYGEIIRGEEITCENCQVRQYDDDWSLATVAHYRLRRSEMDLQTYFDNAVQARRAK